MHSRRKFFEQIVTAGVLLGLKEATFAAAEDIYLKRPLSGRPHGREGAGGPAGQCDAWKIALAV